MIKDVEFCDKCHNEEVKISDKGVVMTCCLCQKKLCYNCNNSLDNPTTLKLDKIICCYDCRMKISIEYKKIYEKLQPEFSKKVKSEFDACLERLKKSELKPKKDKKC